MTEIHNRITQHLIKVRTTITIVLQTAENNTKEKMYKLSIFTFAVKLLSSIINSFIQINLPENPLISIFKSVQYLAGGWGKQMA